MEIEDDSDDDYLDAWLKKKYYNNLIFELKIYKINIFYYIFYISIILISIN
jgi:hypothetical protein